MKIFSMPPLIAITLVSAAVAAPACAQQATDNPFPQDIPTMEGAVEVGYEEFAVIPSFDGAPPRMMDAVAEPATERVFLADMWGVLYAVSYDGETVVPYLDMTTGEWGFDVQARGNERGFQNVALHPQFAEEGTPGYGKFYTYVDVDDTSPTGDFTTPNDDTSHHTLLLEWTAEDASSLSYDGGQPRILIDLVQPYGNHNAGEIAFNPTVDEGDADFGMLYMGVADGGSGGDPMNLAQDPGNAFGKIFRIDPLGSNSANGQYGIPQDNPFVDDDTFLDEIWAYGVRNPQRFGWDPANGNLYLADIGQNTVEELSPIVRGGDLGWNVWEGSFPYVGRNGVRGSEFQTDPDVVYPIAEWGHPEPLMVGRAAVTGVHVERSGAVPALNDKIVFGDNPSGELFWVDADDVPSGGEDSIRRILLEHDGQAVRFLDVIRDSVAEQDGDEPEQADMRFGTGPDGSLLLLNKADGIVRRVVP